MGCSRVTDSLMGGAFCRSNLQRLVMARGDLKMTTLRLSGPGLNDYFAKKYVEEHGEKALEMTSGPMRKAVQRVLDVRICTRETGEDIRDIVGKVKAP